MLDFILQIACSLLMAMSVVFIVIEVRSRFDKSFLIFGITNLLLAIFCAIDIWMQPGLISLYWTRVQHVIAAFFPAFITWYLLVMLRRPNLVIVRIMFFIGFCLALLFFTNVMLRPTEKEIASTMVYNLTFAPYMLVAIVSIIVFLIRNLSRSEAQEKKVLFYHILGGIALSIGGIMDMIVLLVGHRIFPQVPTFTTPGLLLFGLIVTYVFTDRLTTIIKDRETTFGKLQAAYKEMEEVQELKELGQSTAIINHEIKNYAFIIGGYAQFILERGELGEKPKKMATAILETATKLSDFSKEILDFSKARISSDKRPLSIFSLIEACVEMHFPHKKNAITIENPNAKLSIHGDWNKLERVFINIFKNSFEAGATRLTIKALRSDTVLLLVVEDDGKGCSEEQLGQLFKSFYTTKKGSGGTGLGMCIMRSIIETHGGYISAYSKNVLNNGTRGLILNIAFPVYNEEMQQAPDKKDLVVLIKEGVENLAQVIRTFQNVSVTPYIIQRVEEIDAKKIPLEKSAIYASMKSIDQFRKKYGALGFAHVLVEGNRKNVFVVNEMKDKKINTFSENYILENLV